VIDERKNVLLLDTVALIPQKEFYRLSLSLNGKFKLEKIKEIEANKKVSKIINKKILKKKKTQLNLGDGRNFLSEVACKVGDSALINFKDKKVEKCVPLKEKSTVLVFAGKHSGKKGVIEKFNLERKMATLKVEEGSINVLIKQLMALE
jgi:ribosomal protein S4E